MTLQNWKRIGSIKQDRENKIEKKIFKLEKIDFSKRIVVMNLKTI